jgi:hypothetical protein
MGREFMSRPEHILKEAASLVSGQRASQHGDFRLMHCRIAELWSAYLKIDIKAEQVAMCMTLLKAARSELGQYNADDGLDATAYTALWAALTDDSPNETS